MRESNVNTPPAATASANGLGYGPIKPVAVGLNEVHLHPAGLTWRPPTQTK